MARGRKSNLDVARSIFRTIQVVSSLAASTEPTIDEELGQVIAIPLTDIAAELEMRPARARKAVEQATLVGFDGSGPGFFLEDDRLIVWSDLPDLDRTVRLTQSEATALVTALDHAGLDAGDDLRNKLVSAVAPPDVKSISRAINISTSQALGALIQDLAHSIEGSHPLLITHLRVDATEATTRIIEPYGLMIHHGIWYVEAFCRSADEMRIFRLDRIGSHEVLGDETFIRGEFHKRRDPISLEDAPRAELLIHDRVLLDEFTWPGLSVEDPDAHPIRATLPYRGTGWIAHQVVACLGDVEVIGPEEVKRAVAARAADLLGEKTPGSRKTTP